MYQYLHGLQDAGAFPRDGQDSTNPVVLTSAYWRVHTSKVKLTPTWPRTIYCHISIFAIFPYTLPYFHHCNKPVWILKNFMAHKDSKKFRHPAYFCLSTCESFFSESLSRKNQPKVKRKWAAAPAQWTCYVTTLYKEAYCTKSHTYFQEFY